VIELDLPGWDHKRLGLNLCICLEDGLDGTNTGMLCHRGGILLVECFVKMCSKLYAVDKSRPFQRRTYAYRSDTEKCEYTPPGMLRVPGERKIGRFRVFGYPFSRDANKQLRLRP
jgi:hypothetical protein